MLIVSLLCVVSALIANSISIMLLVLYLIERDDNDKLTKRYMRLLKAWLKTKKLIRGKEWSKGVVRNLDIK